MPLLCTASHSIYIELNPESDYTFFECYENSAANARKNFLPPQSICYAGIVI
jgi:hypothetical protein